MTYPIFEVVFQMKKIIIISLYIWAKTCKVHFLINEYFIWTIQLGFPYALKKYNKYADR